MSTNQPVREIGGMVLSPDKSWRFEITDFAALVGALTEPVVNAFCRCFVHADRLTALTELGAMSAERHGEQTVAHSRNLHAMFWFVVGTLRELGLAIGSLRTALHRAGLLDTKAPAWLDLEEIEGWQKDDQLRRLRHQVSFHVDESLVAAGLAALMSTNPVILARGDSRKLHRSELSLGMDAVLRGLELSEEDLRSMIERAAKHQLIPDRLQALFLDVLGRANMDFGKGRVIQPGAEETGASDGATPAPRA